MSRGWKENAKRAAMPDYAMLPLTLPLGALHTLGVT